MTASNGLAEITALKPSKPIINLALSMLLVAAGIFFLFHMGEAACHGETIWQSIFGNRQTISTDGDLDMGNIKFIIWGIFIAALFLLIVAGLLGRQQADDTEKVLKQGYPQRKNDIAENDSKLRDLKH